jgi:PH (Pleckstrin Homology) domain-containing protein
VIFRNGYGRRGRLALAGLDGYAESSSNIVREVPDTHFPAVLGTRERIVAGVLGIGLGFGGPFLLSVVLVAASGDPTLLIFPLPFLGALWVIQGLAPSGFTLEENGVRLERRWLSRVLPYSAIRRCDRKPVRVGGLLAIGVNALFGSHGWRWNPRTGWHYLAITNTRDLVSLHTTAGLLVISPSRPDEFVARLEERLLSFHADDRH